MARPAVPIWPGSLLLVTAALVVVVAAAPASAAEESQGLYAGDLGQALATVAVFALLLVVLGKWAWRPIVRQLRNREEMIAASIEQAQRNEKKAEELLSESQQQLKEVQGRAQAMLAAARQEGARLREQTLEAARKEASLAIHQSEQEIARSRDQALADLQETTARLAVSVAQEILGREISPEDRARLLRQSLDDIRQQASRQA